MWSCGMVGMLDTNIIICIWNTLVSGRYVGMYGDLLDWILFKTFYLLYLRYLVMFCNNSFMWIWPSRSVCLLWGANGPHPMQQLVSEPVPMAPYSWGPGIASYIHGHNESSLKSHTKMLQCNERCNKSDGSRESWIYYPRETTLHSENFQSMVDNESGIKCNAKCWWFNGHVDNWQM